MSDRIQPSKFFVPALPSQYIGHFGCESNTTEALLFRLVLGGGSPTSTESAFVVKGLGGTGKTSALLGVGNHPQTWARFPDAVWFVSIGEHGSPSALLENLETVVRSLVGSSEADEIAFLSRGQTKASAVAQAIQQLNHRTVLLFLDDVWADEKSPQVGQSTVFSLVQDSLRRVQRNPGHLRIVVSTRDASIAALVPDSCRVVAEPFEAADPIARAMLCSYAEISCEDVQNANPFVQESFGAVLDRCAGLQLALAVAGYAVRARMDYGSTEMDDVWSLYAVELAETAVLLKASHPDHSAIYTMIESSLVHLAACLKRDGVILPDDVRVVFSLLGVVKKNELVRLSVVECVWGVSKEETWQLCLALARLHLLSLKKRDDVWWISVHDVILVFCETVLGETPGRRSLAHRVTAEGLEKMLLSATRREVEWDGCAAFWEVCNEDLDMDKWAREYCARNIARHQMEAGEEYVQRLLCLITDYRWVEARVGMSKRQNDLSGVLEDIQAFVTGSGDDLDDNVRSGVELISDAARLSMQYVSINSRELAYQLEGRLRVHAGRNCVVDRFLWSLERYAKRPWLKAGKGVLKAAGGAVVLSASLPESLWCVAVLPNGEDVVVGGEHGYLAMFSIRYACELYKLQGHRGVVRCVSICSASCRVFSCGSDGNIRAWALGTRQPTGRILVRYERELWSLAVTANGSRVVFGDSEGCLTVCDSRSGNVICQWRGHGDRVDSLAVHLDNGVIVSGSRDGTIGWWESENGREVQHRVAVSGGDVNSVVVSRDGQRIAYAAYEKVGVRDAASGHVLRECRTHNTDAWCVVFGLDDETVYFGRGNGTTAALSPDGRVVNDVKAHRDAVWGIAQNRESGLLVSVSEDGTLSVQNIDRFESSRAAGPEEEYILMQFVVLTDRKRILYSWWEGPRGLQLLDLSITSPETVLNGAVLMVPSITIGCADVRVSAISASRDGCWAAAGTTEGKIMVYNTATWIPRHESLRHLYGFVWSAAISNDSAFLAAGARRGDIALFRLEDGREVPLPACFRRQGEALNVAFNEESSSLLATFRSNLQATGMLHVWKNIDQDADVMEHVALPFSRISEWKQPTYPTSMLATDAFIATRCVIDRETYIYDCTNDQYSKAATEEGDDSGLLRLSNREHRALEVEGSLSMEPFGRCIRYCHGSGSEVLGTLEAPICHSFGPEQWTFDGASGLFIVGGFRSSLVSAVLMEEHRIPDSDIQEERPKIPPVHRAVASRVVNSMSAAERSQYSAFISHAGPDKADIARPLYRRLMEKGINTFVDKDELRPGGVAIPKMESAMQRADIGVFITSPDFVCREWPMKELSCFLSRRREAESKGGKPPVLLPVFYRLNVHECRSDDLFNQQEVAQAAIRQGFYGSQRQKEMPIAKVLELLKGLAKFTGIENEEGAVNDALCTGSRMDNQMKRVQLVERVVDAVLEARARRDEEFKQLRESRGRGRCVIA